MKPRHPKALRIAAVCALTGLLLAPAGLDRLPQPTEVLVFLAAGAAVYLTIRRYEDRLQ
ncbi:hypothetical protein [Saccharopolyspora griseoalba]|uniref:Uncharacterized protein n=1 Tax=Saccharopolyspora griseoalba TaxID=1431848 RepID=A0ABW2LH57_9PSEU